MATCSSPELSVKCRTSIGNTSAESAYARQSTCMERPDRRRHGIVRECEVLGGGLLHGEWHRALFDFSRCRSLRRVSDSGQFICIVQTKLPRRSLASPRVTSVTRAGAIETPV